MELILDRSEFFALTALTHARQIIGLDPNALLPADLGERQALYEKGEKSLAQRDLLRYSKRNEVILEQTVRRWLMTLVDPDAVAVAVRQTAEGQQRFLHYIKDGFCVEQTLPDEHTHRWADLESAEASAARFAVVFGISDQIEAGGEVMLPRDAVVELFTGNARDLTQMGITVQAQLKIVQDLAAALRAVSNVTGAVTFLPGSGDAAQAIEAVFVSADCAAFCLTPVPESAQAQLRRVNAASASAILTKSWVDVTALGS